MSVYKVLYLPESLALQLAIDEQLKIGYLYTLHERINYDANGSYSRRVRLFWEGGAPSGYAISA